MIINNLFIQIYYLSRSESTVMVIFITLISINLLPTDIISICLCLTNKTNNLSFLGSSENSSNNCIFLGEK